MDLTIFDIANWFLSQRSMTHKKLQKLCYYAQAWHLALLNKKLFENKFQAWVHGPVNRELYDEYTNYGWNLIPQIKSPNKYIPHDTLEVLESVLFTYGEYSAGDLEYKTHQEKPWQEARNGLGEWEASQNIINEETMRDYYRNIYAGD